MQSSPGSQEGSLLTLSERLVIGLDVGDIDTAKRLVDQLAELEPIFKIGFHTLFSGGLDLAADLLDLVEAGVATEASDALSSKPIRRKLRAVESFLSVFRSFLAPLPLRRLSSGAIGVVFPFLELLLFL